MPLDGAAFALLDERRGVILPAAGWFASADVREAIQPPGPRPYRAGRPGLAEVALERQRALHLPRVEAWEAAHDLRAAAREAIGEEREESVWRAFREASVIACPIRTTLGQPLGVLVVASLGREAPLLGTDELRAVEVVADLAALALERDDLVAAEGRRARDELRLSRAYEAISASLDPDDVYRQVVGQAADVTGATRALLTRLEARAGELRRVAAVELSEGAGRRLPLDHGTVGEVVRSRRAVLGRPGDPPPWDGGEPLGSYMHAPIELGPRVFGVLSVAHEERGRFDHAALEALTKVARSSAAAIANAIDFQRERRIARALTLGFVPESLPEVPGYETGLLYAPAANEPTGGDIYGAWGLPAGEVAVMVGDVAGKGVETAALSAMVRFFAEARSWDTPHPATILEQTNAMLMSRLPSDTFVTAFLGLLSPGRLRWCCAGHLPPFCVSGDDVRPLPAHGLPLGIDPTPRFEESELSLDPGDLVFAYTDGLLEARRGGEIYGFDRLAETVGRHARALAPPELVREVHHDVAAFAEGLGDDAVALALRRRR